MFVKLQPVAIYFFLVTGNNLRPQVIVRYLEGMATDICHISIYEKWFI